MPHFDFDRYSHDGDSSVTGMRNLARRALKCERPSCSEHARYDIRSVCSGTGNIMWDRKEGIICVAGKNCEELDVN